VVATQAIRPGGDLLLSVERSERPLYYTGFVLLRHGTSCFYWDSVTDAIGGIAQPLPKELFLDDDGMVPRLHLGYSYSYIAAVSSSVLPATRLWLACLPIRLV
jgi:hypothetical protein